MVTTRRGAQSSQIDESAALSDADASLRRKPKRQAATNSQNSNVSSKGVSQNASTRTTSRKIKSIEKDLQSDTSKEKRVESDAESQSTSRAPAPQPYASRKTRASQKTNPEVIDEQIESTPPNIVRTARSTRARSQKSQHVPHDAPTASTASRRTRGKKQVNDDDQQEKEESRDVAQEETSLKRKPSSAKTNTITKSSLRKRNLADVKSQDGDNDPAEASSSQARQKRTRRAPQKRPATPSESSMSSKATTPDASPAVAFEQPKNYKEDLEDAQVDDAEDVSGLADSQLQSVVEDPYSDDELAGKKTPMRRGPRQLKLADKRSRGGKLEPGSQHSTQTLGRSQQDASEVATGKDGSASLTITGESQAQDQEFTSSSIEGNAALVTATLPFEPAEDTENLVDESFVLETLRDEDIMPVAEHNILTPRSGQGGISFDPDATIVDDEMESEQRNRSATPASDQSVIITPHAQTTVDVTNEAASEDEDDIDEYDYTELSLTVKTPHAQTIDWAAIQATTIVRANLRMPTSPQFEQGELGIMPDAILSSPTKHEIAARVERDSLVEPEENLEFTDFVSMPPAETSTRTSTPTMDAGATLKSQLSPLERDVSGGIAVELSTESLVRNVMQTSALAPERSYGHTQEAEFADSPLPQPCIESNVAVQEVPYEPMDIDMPDVDDEADRHELNQALSTNIESAATPVITHDDAPEQSVAEPTTPHYMQSTIAFDARRKSMPISTCKPQIEQDKRPFTSDGSNLSGTSTPAEPWWLKARSKPTASLSLTTTPAQTRRVVAPFASAGKNRFTALLQASTPTVQRQQATDDRAKTVAVPYRHARPTTTPSKTPTRERLRRSVFNTSTPVKTHSPARTPLRTLMAMSTVSRMTPHPAVPLRGVVAMVEVYTLEGAAASAPFIALLQRLGAKTTKIWGDRVTHVVFKDGSPSILQRVLLHNKSVQETGRGNYIHCVNSRWVSDCDTQSDRVSEQDSAYVVSTGDLSIASKRKRKSMEPSTVVNIGGSLIQHRKNSWGRSASGRLLGSPMVDSPSQSKRASVEKENSDRSTDSPATPAWIKAPNTLVQATAPLKRVRKLDVAGLNRMKARRRTLEGNDCI